MIVLSDCRCIVKGFDKIDISNRTTGSCLGIKKLKEVIDPELEDDITLLLAWSMVLAGLARNDDSSVDDAVATSNLVDWDLTSDSERVMIEDAESLRSEEY